MIEEEALVAEVGDGEVWVVKPRTSGCSSCSEACPSSLASGLLSGTEFRLKLSSGLPLKPGDRVMLGIANDKLVSVSAGIYLLPLLFFFIGAFTGEYLFNSDMAAVLGGLSGLALCLAYFKHFKLFDRESCQTVILHKII
ncbi:MAG: SoxR reducing system RseC family protein [Candidatus Methylumidiphilus sp.]